MHRIFLQLGPLTITWYGVMAGLGATAGLISMRKLKSVAEMNDDQCYDLLLYGMISGIIGARLFYVVQFWDRFKDNLAETIMVHHGGLVFYGGFLLAIAALHVFCRRNKLDFVRVLDVCAPSMAVAHFFGRIGCFLNGCCFGKRTGSVFGVVFPEGSDPFSFYGGLVKIHPTQLYEALGNIVIFFILYRLIGRMKRGQTAALYLVLYGSLRIAVECFRGDHKDFLFGMLTPAQSIGALIVPVGIIALLLFGRKNDNKQKQV